RTLGDLGVAADFVGSSAEWGVWKPSPLFFARVAEEAGCRPSEIAYVGDRVDNDVVPAATAGMVAVFLRRGPWALLHAHRPEAYGQVKQRGFELVNADVVLIGNEPRVAPVREAMETLLVSTLGEGSVTVRATTTDGLGFTGRGEGLAAQAVALLQRVA